MAREPLNLAELLKDPVTHGDQSAALGQTEKRAQGGAPKVEAGSLKKHQTKLVGVFVGAVFVAGAWGVRSDLKPAVGSLFRPAVTSEQSLPLPDRSKQAPRPQQATEATPPRAVTAPPKKAVIAAHQPSPDLNAYSKPVQELMHYLEGLKRGRFSFNWGITGEEAAKQLGFTRLFASNYEEMILRVKARESVQGGLRVDDIIADFEKIVQEEQGIDWLMARGAYATVTACLRAFQNGDIVFPAPAELAPTPAAIVGQLGQLYPSVALDPDDAVFATVYRGVREFATVRVKDTGEVYIYEIIGELRRAIIKSVLSPPSQGKQL